MARKDPCELSPRELEAFRLLGEGLSNIEIAGRMGIQTTTVREYMKRLHDKLYIVSRGRLIVESYKRFSVEDENGKTARVNNRDAGGAGRAVSLSRGYSAGCGGG